MADKNYAEIIYVASSFAMLFVFTAAFIYYILYTEILIILVGIGLIAFFSALIAKNKWEKSNKS